MLSDAYRWEDQDSFGSEHSRHRLSRIVLEWHLNNYRKKERKSIGVKGEITIAEKNTRDNGRCDVDMIV